jgi:DDE family transposase
VAERVVFALVAQRACEPGSKLAATGWVAQRVAIESCPPFTEDAAYAAMDFLLEALGEIAAEVFGSVAHLLNLDLDIVFVDTTSTYWETETADELAELAEDPGDELGSPTEAGARTFGHSKDHRGDLPQVVIAMAVTRDGVPVRCWTFPGNTADTAIIRTVKDDLGGWGLRRLVWVADRGFASAANRAYLTRGGGHYIHAEKLRHTNTEAAAALARPGRYRTVADNLRVKEVAVAPGGDRDGDDGARTQRFVICHNPEQDQRDQQVRANLVTHLQQLIEGSDDWTSRRRDELVGSLRGKPGLRRYLRRTTAGLLRVDQAAIKREAHLDGKWLLRTSDTTLTPDDLAAAYKQLLAVERGWRDFKGALGLRPVFHYREDRIRAHIQLCWLALLLLRVIENATGDTWRNLRRELDRMHLVTLATNAGQIAQRSTTTPGQQVILRALDLPEPPRFFDFTLPDSR